MKIIIAGGTGFIGQALAAHFKQKNHNIAVVSRSAATIHKIFGDSVSKLTWDNLTVADINSSQVIINLAGANIADKLWSSQRKQELIDSRVSSTRQLSELINQSQVKDLLFISASGIGTYPTDKQNYDESSSLVAHSFLSQLAQQWEEATLPAHAKARVINMRLAVVIGRNGGMLARLLPIYKLGLGAKIGNGQQPFPWISLRDVINAIDFLIQHPTIAGPVNFIAPQQITQAEFNKTLAKILHRPSWIKIPAALLKLSLGQMAEELLLSGQCAVPKVLLNREFTFQHPTLEQALNYYIH